MNRIASALITFWLASSAVQAQESRVMTVVLVPQWRQPGPGQEASYARLCALLSARDDLSCITGDSIEQIQDLSLVVGPPWSERPAPPRTPPFTTEEPTS